MEERPKETFQNYQVEIPLEIPNVGDVQSEEFGIYRNQISTKASLRLLNNDNLPLIAQRTSPLKKVSSLFFKPNYSK